MKQYMGCYRRYNLANQVIKEVETSGFNRTQKIKHERKYKIVL